MDPCGTYAVAVGDICIQQAASGKRSTWVFGADEKWSLAAELSPHPLIRGYVLHHHERVARWIQKKSVQTYAYRSSQEA